MNVFGNKASSGLVQPWSDTFAFGKEIRNFYESRGDAVISSPTEIATLLDGPEKVVRYGALTLSSTLTASLRCKGLTVICDSLTVNSGGNLHMTGRGCRVDRNDDPRYPFIDFYIPNKIGLASEVMSRQVALALIKKRGLAPWDRGFWDVDGGMLGLSCSIAEAGTVQLMAAIGCGAGGPGVSVGSNSFSSTSGGAAGANGGCGGGGAGSVCSLNNGPGAYTRNAGSAHPYSGGSGSGGVNNNYNGYAIWYMSTNMPDPYSGPGSPGFNGGQGGAASGSGNPCLPAIAGYAPTHGTGGKLVIICYGNVVINSGGKIEANGVSALSYGGGSGGGHVSLIHGGTYTNNGTVQAAGGSGGSASSGGNPGGSGGAGSVITKTFAQMGWS